MPVLLGVFLGQLGFSTGSRDGCPTMLRVTEEEAHARRAAVTAQAQRIVLVVAGEALVARAPLADDVNLLAVLDAVGGHPSLERDGIALRELQRALRARVFHADELALAAEPRRRAVRLELRKLLAGLRALPDGDLTFDDAIERRSGRAGRGVLGGGAGVIEPPVSGGLVREDEVGVAGGLGSGRGVPRRDSSEQQGGEQAQDVHSAKSG